MRYVISIDPGAVHCGVAYWARSMTSITAARPTAGRPSADEEIWECHWAVEMTPDDCVDYIKRTVEGEDPPAMVFVEGFWLKGGMDAIRQAGSQMETTQVIGTIRNLCRWSRVGCTLVANGQKAIITRLTAAGYVWSSSGSGGHAKDAEAVGVRGLGLKVRQLKSVLDARKAEA